MLLYSQAICPHCGNDVTVKSEPEVQKCKWCRRLMKVKIMQKGNKKKKRICEVELMDFPTESPGFQKRSLNDWRDRDIYGF